MADEPNPSFVGRAGAAASQAAGNALKLDATGFKALRSELTLASKVLNEGLLMGVFELATGGSKVKAVWESIKWGALARAGLGGFVILLTAVNAFTGGIRKAINESEALQAAMRRLEATKVLTKQFETFLGSVAEAKKRVSELYAFTANSKFDFGDVAAASRTLTVLSNGALGGGASLKMLGRVSSATGVNIQDLAGTVADLNQKIRNKEDISASLNSLRDLGVISETTAAQLNHLSETGAPPAAIWKETQAAIQGVSDAVGDTELTISELEQKANNAKEAMLAAFGADFVAAHRTEVELTGKAYENLTPAMASVGKLLAVMTAPAETLKMQMKEVTASKGFGNMVKSAGEFVAIMPAVLTAWGVLKGGSKLLGSAGKAYSKGGAQNVWDTAKGAVSPQAEAMRLNARASEQAERRGQLRSDARELQRGSFVARRAGDTVRADRMMSGATEMRSVAAGLARAEQVSVGTSKGLMGVSKALGFLRAGALAAGTAFMSFLPILLIVSGITIILTKLWEKYSDSVERSSHADAMTTAMLQQNAAMKEQIALLKTLDDHLLLVAKARQQLNDALSAQDEVNADPDASEGERASAKAAVNKASRNLKQVEAVNTDRLAPGAEAQKLAEKRLQTEKQIRDMAWEAEFSAASAAKQVLMLTQKRLEMLKIIKDYAAGEESQPGIAGARGEVTAAEARGQDRITHAKKIAEKAEETEKEGKKFWNRSAILQTTPASALEAGTERARAKVRELESTPGEDLVKAKANLAKQLAGGSTADKFEAAAMNAKDPREAYGLRMEAAKRRVTEPEEAKRNVQQYDDQRQALQRQGAQKKADLDMGSKILQVTSESYQAENQIAEIKKARIDRERQLLVDTPENTKDPEAKKQRDLQIAAFDQQKAEIDKGTAERARQLAREKTQWDTAIHVHELNNEALRAAAKGNFAQADIAMLAAQKASDDQAQLDRAHELLVQGVGQEAAAAMVAAEQKERDADRAAKAEVFRTGEGRRIREKELSNAESGLGPDIGVGGAAARKQRVGMEDVDALRSETMKNMQELGAGHEQEASDLAKRSVSADIIANAGQLLPGSGAVASSDAKLGLGGGVYAGVSGDPQLAATNRIAALNEKQVEVLNAIKDNLKMGVK